MHYGDNNINAGPLKEIPEICIDRFIKDDLKSTVFFLSHGHTDHMVGLETEAFMKRLNDPEVHLYCQAITPIIVRFFNRYLGGKSGIEKLIAAKKIIPLDADKPFVLDIPCKPYNYSVKVTLLSAGHCPGSVMFLFETESTRILHTGDCRLKVSDLKEIRHLHVGPLAKRQIKTIDHLYVDTTFCSKSADLFPERRNAFDDAINHIREWIAHGERHYVLISMAARFAHEYVLLELYREFGKKVHVDKERYSIYEEIPVIENCVSLNPDTPFHLCGNRDCMIDKEFITLRLASMWYTMSSTDAEERSSILRRGRILNVCYAMHSSLTEIAEMIDYLKPTVVTPLVKPRDSTLKEVHDSLRSCCSWNFEFQDYRNEYEVPSNNSVDDNSTQNATNPEDDNSALSEFEIDDDDEMTLPKRFKINSNDPCKWNFQFSPSPRKGSDSSRENSQEIIAELLRRKEDMATLPSNVVDHLEDALENISQPEKPLDCVPSPCSLSPDLFEPECKEKVDLHCKDSFTIDLANDSD